MTRGTCTPTKMDVVSVPCIRDSVQVTRSRIEAVVEQGQKEQALFEQRVSGIAESCEASYFPQVIEELKQERVKLEATSRSFSSFRCWACTHAVVRKCLARQLRASRNVWTRRCSR